MHHLLLQLTLRAASARDGVTALLDRRKERGASLVEYALLLALIVMVCVAGVTMLGERTSASFDSFSTRF